MKNALLITAIAISLQVSAHTLPSAPHMEAQIQKAFTGFDFIRAHKQGKTGLTLQWKMGGTANVDYFELQCTYEDPMDLYSNWSMIGKVNNLRTMVNSFTDQPIYPGIIHYKITAVLKNGAGVIEAPIFTTVID